MWLPNQVIKDVEEQVDEIFYLSYATTRVFNETRHPGTPLVFSGWYWAKGTREGGPFKSQSAAWRDAWYAFCSKTKMPRVHDTVTAAAAEAEARAKKQRRAATRLKLMAAA